MNLCGCFYLSIPCSNVTVYIRCYFVVAIGKECEKYMKQGSLVPDQIMEDMIISEMKNMQKDAWLLDGNCCIYL